MRERNNFCWTRLIIISVLSAILFTEGELKGQMLEKQLLQLEQQAYLHTSDTARNNLYLAKQDLYIKYKVIDERAFNETQRVNNKLLDSLLRIRYLWNSAIISYLNNEYNHAKFYMARYKEHLTDTTIQYLLLQAAIQSRYDSVEASGYVRILEKKDSTLSSLRCFNYADGYERRNRNLFLVLSAIVPGSGSIVQGEVVRGGTSLLLNGAVAYGITMLVQRQLYINAVAWGLGLGLKFYKGNILLTEKIFEEKEEETKSLLTNECKKAFDEALRKYPLRFK